MAVTKTSTGRWRAYVKSGRQTAATRTFDRKGDAEAWHDYQKRALDLGEFIDPRAGRESLGAAMLGGTQADRALLRQRPGTRRATPSRRCRRP
jgi:hypothetical protein